MVTLLRLEGLFTQASGAVLEQKCDDITILSGLIPFDTQTTVNGLSGAITLSATNDGLIITEVGQDIQFFTSFNSISGVLVNQIATDVAFLSGLIFSDSGQTSINGLSGQVQITSPDNTILIGDNGQSIEISGLYTQASGALLQQKCEDIDTLSGLIGIGDAGQTSIQGISGVVQLEGLDGTVVITVDGQTIQLSGLYNPASGQIVDQRGMDISTLSGLILPDGGQTSINGLSGVVVIQSPDGSILIGDSDQAIELSGLFTATSGALLQQKCEDIDTLSGLINSGAGGQQTTVNGLSGTVLITSPDGSILIGQDGQAVELSGLFTTASGALLDQKCDDIDTLSGLIQSGGGGAQTSINGLSGTVTLSSTNDGIVVNEVGQDIQLTPMFTSTSGELIQSISGITDGLIRAQTTIAGLSGTVGLSSPNATVLININGQTIELEGLFTQASGAVLQQKCDDIDTLSGLIGIGDAGQTSINGLSGVVEIISPDSSILIGDSPQSIELSGLFTAASGAVLEQKCRDISSISGVAYSNSGVLEERIENRIWHGIVSGLTLSINPINSGLFDIAEGVAYVSGLRLEVDAQSGIDPQFISPGIGDTCIFTVVGLDRAGSIVLGPADPFEHTQLDTIVELGTVQADHPQTPQSGLIDNLISDRYTILNRDYTNSMWHNFIAGSLVSSGMQAADNGSLTLTVGDGVYYDQYQNRHIVIGQQPLSFFNIHSESDGQVRVQFPAVTTVNNTQYDDGTGLTNINGNRYVAHTLWYQAVARRFYLVFSTDQYDSLQLAQESPISKGCLGDIPEVMPIARIIIRRNQTVFSGNTGRIVDLRRILAGGIGGATETTVSTATSLQGAYDNSDVTEIVLDDDKGGFTIADDADSPLCANGVRLIEIIDTSRSIEYFGVCAGSGVLSPSGHFSDKVGIGIPRPGVPRCQLDVSGLICTSGLEVTGTRPTLSGIGLATLNDIIDTQMSLNGLSGAVTLSSTNDGLEINEVSQDIQFTPMFTSASGELIQSISGITDGLSRTQTSVEGLSGVVDLDSPNGTILIDTNGQTIELEGLFTQASGAVLQQKCEDILAVSGITDGLPRTQTTINGISGAVTFESQNNGLVITANGSKIEFNSLFTTMSGTFVDDIERSTRTYAENFTSASGTEFVMYHGKNTEDFVWSLWRTDRFPIETIIPVTVAPSGNNHVVVKLAVGVSGKLVLK